MTHAVPSDEKPCLDIPLLGTHQFQVGVVVNSHEWDEDRCSTSSDEEPQPLESARRDRYAKMAAAQMVGGDNLMESGDLHSGRPMNIDKLRCVSALVLFAESTLSFVVILILVLRDADFATLLYLLPSHLVAVSLEAYLTCTDRCVVRWRQMLETRGSHWRLRLFDAGAILLSLLFFHTIVRAQRFWNSKPYRRTFLMDLEAQDPGKNEVNEARLDSHPMFLSSVPRVIAMATVLVQRQSWWQERAFVALLMFSVLSILQAVVNFDYHASRHIKMQYSMGWFRIGHFLLRLTEVLSRVLVLIGGVLASRVFPIWVGSMALLDYVLGAVVLQSVSASSSMEVWLLSVPMLVCDLGKFVDDNGYAVAARRLSRMLMVVRFLSFLVAAFVFEYCAGGSNTGDIRGFAANILFHLLLVCQATHILFMWSRVCRVGDDVFTATLRDSVESLKLLAADSWCDIITQASELMKRNPLHMAELHRCFESACFLLRAGADPKLRDANGETPLHVACRLGDGRFVESPLQEHHPCGMHALASGTASGALKAVCSTDSQGRTPFQVLHRDVPRSLAQRLAAAERCHALEPQTPKKLPIGPPVEPFEADALKELFGPLLSGEHFDFLDRNEKPSRLSAQGLVPFLLSKGVGEQLANVLFSLYESVSSCKLRLTGLQTLGVLGRGGFGKVIKVMDARTGELYAMKLQHKDRTTKCALREAQALHMSDHPFIVRLVHIFHTKTFFCLVMELCDKDLNAYMLDSSRAGLDGLAAASPGLPRVKVARYSVCVMLALEYLHVQRVVFRDLKPENVLIQESVDCAKLTDFGLASRVDSAEDFESRRPEECRKSAFPPVDEATACTRFRVPISGTRGFMSAEVYSPVGRADALRKLSFSERLKWEASRDWYGLGCCLLLMLLGERVGTVVACGKRAVLLPPSAEEISCVLDKAISEADADVEALCLTKSLTASSVANRGAAREMRASPFLQAAVADLEAFVRGYVRDVRHVSYRKR